MIKICIIKDNRSLIRGFTVKGHAGYAGSGNDIVCAAISALAYTAVGALSKFSAVCDYDESHGYMKCIVSDNISETLKRKAKIILETIILGFKQIESEYGGYVSVSDKQVSADD